MEYRLGGHKLGYLLGEVVDGVILIETALFLTMNGTPEGDLLWARLGLRREDKEYLRLDDPATFVASDVRFDPELVKILTECGCGHLFNLLKNPVPEERSLKGCAADIRKHLRLDESTRTSSSR